MPSVVGVIGIIRDLRDMFRKITSQTNTQITLATQTLHRLTIPLKLYCSLLNTTIFLKLQIRPSQCREAVADLEILKGGFGRLVGAYTAHRRRWCAEPQSGDQSARSAANVFYVFFLAIRKHSRSISVHSGHVPRRKED